MELIAILWIVLGGIVGGLIGKSREQPIGGFLIGALFGPIGWLIAFLSDCRPKCPACMSRYSTGATICPQCREPIA